MAEADDATILEHRLAPAIDSAAPRRIGGYLILNELGRGGMARVYRAVAVSGRQVALKQLLNISDSDRRQQAGALFEREFHTLAQLSHPSVIEVYDYGIADDGPYYTMELLDGGDLRGRGVLPWREACTLLYDVCSSLALLHSRRLVHRDVTPRNVHCTTSGRAKLIDFGAMVPMGPSGKAVGTPAFVAPEVVHRSTIDGRADLYSLGVTIYHAITGRVPYPARDFSSVHKAWLSTPLSLSLLVADIPPALDALVMSMISLEPAMRPRSAFEVMQRLAAIARIELAESLSVSQAYLTTPMMVGREEPLSAFRDMLRSALQSSGSGLLIEAEAGLGRSRLLDGFALEAKLMGVVTLRAGATSTQTGRMSVAVSLSEQLIDALPEAAREAADALNLVGTLFETQAEPVAPELAAHSPQSRLRLRAEDPTPAAQGDAQANLAAWFRRIGARHALLIAVDDAERIDAASVAVLAAIAQRVRRSRVLLVLVSDPAAQATNGLEVVSPRCTKLALRPLDLGETEALLSSVFGDVQHVALLAHRIHAVAAGRPRECMALAQLLVDRGAVSYAGGSWTLPAQLSTDDLPARGGDVFQARVAALEPRARRLAQAHALSPRVVFSGHDYALLDSAASSEQLDSLIGELVRQQVLEGDGESYRLSHGALSDALQHSLEPSERKRLHLELAELFGRTGRPAFQAAFHLFEAELFADALDTLMAALDRVADLAELERHANMSIAECTRLLTRALDASEALARKSRERYELRRWMVTIGIVAEDSVYRRAAPVLLSQLERDSGLAIYREIDDEADAMRRLTRALERTQQRYAETPDAERIYTVEQAIKGLVDYSVTSIAVGARTLDLPLVTSLAPLLEPFAPLSPAIHAMWQNALAIAESHQRKIEHARARWAALYQQLEHITPAQLARVDMIRGAIAYALGLVDSLVGLETIGRWAAVLDGDPAQRVNAMYLRKAACMQRGDFDGAERFRRKAEVLAIQASSRQMFQNTMTVELGIHALARDLTGVKQIMDRIELIAAREPRWLSYQYLATAQFHRLRGDLAAACVACERALSLATPDASDPGRTIIAWPSIAATYIETLVELGRAADARVFGESVLETCAMLEIECSAFDIIRALALAEGSCGALTEAVDRLEALIAAQHQLGVFGLNLGVTYEARARIAIWAGDHAAVEHYGRLAAIEYRHGRSSSLGTRYERLVQEARGAGVYALPELAAVKGSTPSTTALGIRLSTIETSLTEAMKSAGGTRERAELALNLLCEAHAASGGHLYLMREGGLTLAASLETDAPDASLPRMLQELWQQQVAAADMPTTFGPDATASPSPITSTCTDVRGTSYHPVVISCMLDGTPVLAGIAALVPGRGPLRRADARDVAGIIGSYLVRAGDASPFAR